MPSSGSRMAAVRSLQAPLTHRPAARHAWFTKCRDPLTPARGLFALVEAIEVTTTVEVRVASCKQGLVKMHAVSEWAPRVSFVNATSRREMWAGLL